MSLFNLGPKLPAGVTKAKIVDKTRLEDLVDADDVIQLMVNDGVNICSHACSSCWDVKLPADYEGRSEYVSRRTATGHSSVTEHANNVFYLAIPKSDINDLVEVLDVNKYLHTCVRFSNRFDYIYMIIGGSWRAWNYLLGQFEARNAMLGTNNHVASRLLAAVYSYCDWSGFADMIKGCVMQKNKFVNVNIVGNYDNVVDLSKTGSGPIVVSDKIDIYGLDNINKIVSMLTAVCPEPELFRVVDMFDFCTCTVLFKNMSRIITQQLVRHRNAITQESQRYVDYSNACFNSPAKFKDIYDPDYKYSVTFGRSTQKMNLQEIGDSIAKIYGQLSDKDKLGKLALLKEDARGYLPSNVQCRKIFITFTWSNLFAFLRLREDKPAQAEIHSYAMDIGNWFAEQFPDFVPMYRKEAGDPSWVAFPIPNKNTNVEEEMDKEKFIEVIEDSIKTETINTTSEDNKS